jgi:hypothetical protein
MLRRLFEYLVCVVIGVIIGFFINQEPKPDIQEPTEDSLIRDSIYIVNDSLVEKIIYLEKQYDDEVKSIISANDSMQLLIFSRYIDSYIQSDTSSQLNIYRTQEVFSTDSINAESNKELGGNK